MHRLKVEATANNLRPVLTGWSNETDNLFRLVPRGDRLIAEGILAS